MESNTYVLAITMKFDCYSKINCDVFIAKLYHLCLKYTHFPMVQPPCIFQLENQ